MNRFQGDPAIKLTPDGAKMKFIGGQPIMDQGFDNAVQISLFTKPGWWGNDLVIEDNKKIGSTFQEQRTIVDIQTINDYTDAAKLALNWMIDNNIASKIEINVTNPNMNYIKTSIFIYPPGQDASKLLFLQNGINWISQAKNPAYERLENVI